MTGYQFLQNCINLFQSVAKLLLNVQKSNMAADAILDFIFVFRNVGP